jgi:exodeoxyribonuclease-5
MQLTNEQKEVIKGIVKCIDDFEIITFGGIAGCGKTTVCKILLQVLQEKKRLRFAVAAYTGKAANILRKKGVSAQTIHATIYRATTNDEDETEWYLIPKYELSDIDGFIIDEASMVSKEIHDDLISYGKPIIYVGDHGQLEPVGSKFNLMENPMFKLETVHRNAGEIAHFAYHLRQGKPAFTFKAEKNVQVVQNRAIQDRHLASVDQVICAYNKSRVKINNIVRTVKEIDDTFIAQNEKIICLRNNRQFGLYNGMQGIVTKIYKRDYFDFIANDQIYHKIKYDCDQFGKNSYKFEKDRNINPFDYAYAITAHKSQGDEFGSVIAMEEKSELWDHKRWAYTVASRAKKSLIWVSSEIYTPSYIL